MEFCWTDDLKPKPSTKHRKRKIRSERDKSDFQAIWTGIKRNAGHHTKNTPAVYRNTSATRKICAWVECIGYIVYSVVCVRECVNAPASNVCHMFVKLKFALNKNKVNGKKEEASAVTDENKTINRQNHSKITFCWYVFTRSKKGQRRTWTVQMHFQTLNSSSSSSISGNSTHFWYTLTQHDTEWNMQTFNGIDFAIEKNREQKEERA